MFTKSVFFILLDESFFIDVYFDILMCTCTRDKCVQNNKNNIYIIVINKYNQNACLTIVLSPIMTQKLYLTAEKTP